MAVAATKNRFSKALKARRHKYDREEVVQLFLAVSEERVDALASKLVGYISVNLPAAFEKRQGLSHYRTNPYVLVTAASVMKLSDPANFAKFLFDSKLYMALETSFGKQRRLYRLQTRWLTKRIWNHLPGVLVDIFCGSANAIKCLSVNL